MRTQTTIDFIVSEKVFTMVMFGVRTRLKLGYIIKDKIKPC